MGKSKFSFYSRDEDFVTNFLQYFVPKFKKCQFRIERFNNKYRPKIDNDETTQESINEEVSVRPGRPSNPDSNSRRTIQRKGQKVLEAFTPTGIKAAALNEFELENPGIKKKIKFELSNPNIEKEMSIDPENTPLEALKLITSLNLTRDQYQALRNNAKKKGLKKLYPSYRKVLNEKKNCLPNSFQTNLCETNVDPHEAVNLTLERILKGI